MELGDTADDSITEYGRVGPGRDGIGGITGIDLKFIVKEGGADGEVTACRKAEQSDGVWFDIEFDGTGTNDFNCPQGIQLRFGVVGLGFDAVFETEGVKAETVKFFCDRNAFV